MKIPPPGGGAWSFTRKRFFQIAPFYYSAFAIYGIRLWIAGGTGIKGILPFLYGHIWELTFLNSLNFSHDFVYWPAWYLSALFIAGYFVYAMLRHNKKLFISIVAPLAVFIIYPMMQQIGVGLDMHVTPLGSFVAAPLRGFAGLCLGVLTYQLYLRLKTLSSGKITRTVTAAVEILAVLAAGYTVIGKTHTPMNFAVLVFFPVLIAITSLKTTPLAKLLDRKVFAFLGKISLSMYLISGFATVIYTHLPIPVRIFENRLLYIFLFLCADVVIATVFYYMVTFAKYVYGKLKKRPESVTEC